MVEAHDANDFMQPNLGSAKAFFGCTCNKIQSLSLSKHRPDSRSTKGHLTRVSETTAPKLWATLIFFDIAILHSPTPAPWRDEAFNPDSNGEQGLVSRRLSV
jgi:hypothetical protein